MTKINLLYQELLPDVYQKSDQSVNESVLEKLSKREKEFYNNELFFIYFLRKYLTLYNYDEETYPMLLNTFPKIIKSNQDRRENFLYKVKEILKEYGKISMPVLTTVIVCKRKDFFLNSLER